MKNIYLSSDKQTQRIGIHIQSDDLKPVRDYGIYCVFMSPDEAKSLIKTLQFHLEVLAEPWIGAGIDPYDANRERRK